uniref:Uncharacterized protein n=1 Tax=Romanomermis culicivorax TaxID=13658 RepID=A0A915IPG2_ROMCU
MESLCGHSLVCPICERRLLHLYEHLTKLCMANRRDEIDDTIDRIEEKELKIVQNEVILKFQIIRWGGCTDLIVCDLSEKSFTIKNDIQNEEIAGENFREMYDESQKNRKYNRQRFNEEIDESDDDYVDDENVENEDEEEDRTELTPVTRHTQFADIPMHIWFNLDNDENYDMQEKSLTSSISDAGTYNNVKNLIFNMQSQLSIGLVPLSFCLSL